MSQDIRDNNGRSCTIHRKYFQNCKVPQTAIWGLSRYYFIEMYLKLIPRFDIDWNNKDEFFTNAERSIITKEILERTSYSGEKSRFGTCTVVGPNTKIMVCYICNKKEANETSAHILNLHLGFVNN